jgi:hypothetical protein
VPMPAVTGQPTNAEAAMQGPSHPPGPRTRTDWRGWIALAWVVFWGWAYALMAIQARSPQVLAWVRTVARLLGRLTRFES